MSTYAQRIQCAFTSKEYENTGNTHINGTAIRAVDAFITAGGEFIAWLSGHTHFDIVEKANISGIANTQISISANTASSNLPCDGRATVGSRSQDCLNAISVDTVDKVIRIVRVGREYSRWMQKRDSICIRYTTGEVMAQSNP